MYHHKWLVNGESLSVLGFMHDFPIKSPIWEKGEGIKAKAESSFFRCRSGAIWSAPVFFIFLSQLILSFTPINQDRVSPNKKQFAQYGVLFTETLLNIADERRTSREKFQKKVSLSHFPW